MISQSQKKGLYLVSTPIGNLGDFTIRALEILKNSDLILCEDTRVSIKLLNHFNIKTQLVSFHKFNERKKTQGIISDLKDGKIISLISDAGTPLISDPGKILVKECLNKNIPVIPIPGPSSVITALSVSGFSDKFIFYGFLADKKNKFIQELELLSKMNFSVVIFIRPKKFIKNLDSIMKFFDQREVVICREMTKIHEEFIRCKVHDIKKINIYDKGELTIVFSEMKEDINSFGFLSESDKQMIKKMLKTKSIKDILKKFSTKKVSKKTIYDLCLKLKNEK